MSKVPRPTTGQGRWSSFVADSDAPGGRERALREPANPEHRLRLEHDAHTLLRHLSDEEGPGWTTVAVDRAPRRWAVAQRRRRTDATHDAYEGLYEP